MSRTKKVAILTIITMILTMFPVSAFAVVTSERIYGDSRVQTALEICGAGWSSAQTAILAPADEDNLVDALASAGLAGQEDAPILLTYKNNLDPSVKAKIASLGVRKVYVVGAISGSVASEVDAMTNVSIEVLKGSNRWATAAAINDKLTNPAGSFVVGYNAIPDALSVASYAAQHNYAIILAGTDGRLPSGQAVLGSKVYTVGGPSLVADINGAERIAGTNRFDTNKKVVEKLDFSYSRIYVANGITGLVDALAVAPLASKADAFVALTDGTDVAAASVLSQKMSTSTQVTALGGWAVVSDNAKNKIKYGTSNFAVESFKALSATQLEIKFSKPVDKDTVISSENTLVPAIEVTPLSGADDVSLIGDGTYAELSTDELTLTIGTNDTVDEYFDGTYIIHIPAGITSKTYGEELGAYSQQITVNDRTAPEVRSVVYNAATDQIDVLMSEILEVAPTITVNNGSNVSADVDGMGTKYSFDNQWDRGDSITVRVYNARDYKGNWQASTYTKELTITMDETELNVTSIMQSASNEIEIVFNKDLAPVGSASSDQTAREDAVESAITVLRGGTSVIVSDVYTDSTSSKSTFKVVLEDGNGPEYSDIYNGKSSSTLTINFAKAELRDVFGNTNDDISKTVTMTKDVTGPEVLDIKLSSDEKNIVVRFNEDVHSEDSDKLLVRKNGINVSDDFNSMVAFPTAKEITFNYGDIIPNGTYNIRIEQDAISDDHGNTNTFQSKDITITSGESSVTVISIADTGTENVFRVEFSDSVNTTAIDPYSYTLNGATLPSSTEIYFEDSSKDTVIIELPENSVNYNSTTASLRVFKVEGIDGVKVEADQDTITVVDNVKPTLIGATLAGNVLTLSFDENMAESIGDLSDLIADLEIKGGSNTLTGNGTVSAYAEGKKIYITVTNVGDSNWNTIKAYSTITIKTLDDSISLGDDDTDGSIQNILKKDVTVLVTKL